MPIIDNSSHLLWGLFWQEKKNKASGSGLLSIAPKGPVERNNRNPEILIPRGLQVLWQEPNRASGNFHTPGGPCHPGQLCHCSQQHGASDQTVRAFRNGLTTRQAFATPQAAPNPQDGKNNLYVIIQAWSAVGKSELLRILNLAANTGSFGKTLRRKIWW